MTWADLHNLSHPFASHCWSMESVSLMTLFNLGCSLNVPASSAIPWQLSSFPLPCSSLLCGTEVPWQASFISKSEAFTQLEQMEGRGMTCPYWLASPWTGPEHCTGFTFTQASDTRATRQTVYQSLASSDPRLLPLRSPCTEGHTLTADGFLKCKCGMMTRRQLFLIHWQRLKQCKWLTRKNAVRNMLTPHWLYNVFQEMFFTFIHTYSATVIAEYFEDLH